MVNELKLKLQMISSWEKKKKNSGSVFGRRTKSEQILHQTPDNSSPLIIAVQIKHEVKDFKCMENLYPTIFLLFYYTIVFNRIDSCFIGGNMQLLFTMALMDRT